MQNVPEKITLPLNRNSLAQLNRKTAEPLSRNTISSLNGRTMQGREREIPNRQNPGNQPAPPASVPGRGAPQPPNPGMQLPQLKHPLRKGQKTALEMQGTRMEIRFGWNVSSAQCDVDASAFLLGENGRVLGDEWFVFYGQPESPDHSLRLGSDVSGQDRERMTMDVLKLNPRVQKIVFVLTIHEAFEHQLNFSMVKGAYLRILSPDHQEIVSFRLEDAYENVTSMTIGELYQHNGQWKFNPVGNGVHKDLAGQCAIYGVQIN